VRDGRIETFRTFMTGEFYHLLAERSVLRLLAQVSQDEIAQIAAFRRGVMASTEKGGILNLAFQARAGVLADTLKPTDVELYLSGLLIGEEILNGRRLLPQNLPLVLVAGGRMAALYNEAFTILGSAVMTVDPERAFVDGLLRIVSHQKGVRNVRGR
jgi:2-dehydro-3-deoxygalactonokinase